MIGSLVNKIMSESKHPTPEVGMGATICMWSDRHAGTIVRVSKSGKEIDFQYDEAHRVDKNGISESQEYEYKRNPDASILTFTLRKDGRWVMKGEPTHNGRSLAIGFREKYYDFTF